MKSSKKQFDHISFTYGNDSKLYSNGDLSEQYFYLFNEVDLLKRVSCQEKFLIGSTEDGYGLVLVWDESAGDEAGVLTMELFSEILNAAKEVGITKRPIYIHATVNAGPNGSPSYVFNQMKYKSQ